MIHKHHKEIRTPELSQSGTDRRAYFLKQLLGLPQSSQTLAERQIVRDIKHDVKAKLSEIKEATGISRFKSLSIDDLSGILNTLLTLQHACLGKDSLKDQKSEITAYFSMVLARLHCLRNNWSIELFSYEEVLRRVQINRLPEFVDLLTQAVRLDSVDNGKTYTVTTKKLELLNSFIEAMGNSKDPIYVDSLKSIYNDLDKKLIHIPDGAFAHLRVDSKEGGKREVTMVILHYASKVDMSESEPYKSIGKTTFAIYGALERILGQEKAIEAVNALEGPKYRVTPSDRFYGKPGGGNGTDG
ncbi:MAG: hypothetical protein V1909_03075 [Candidatus Micrarchaeota archaeon]